MSDFVARMRMEAEQAPVVAAVQQTTEAVRELGTAGETTAASAAKTSSAVAKLAEDSKVAGQQASILGRELTEVASQAAAGAGSLQHLAAEGALTAGAINNASIAHGHMAASGKLASHEMLNLGRQLNDVATMAALGANPMMILASQGGQIAQVFTEASTRGVTFKAALAQIGGGVLGLIGQYGGLIAATGAVGVAVYGVVRGFQEQERLTKGVAAAEVTLTNAMSDMRAVIDGVTDSTLKLASARREAAAAGGLAAVAAANTQIRDIEHPSFLGGLGRFFGTISGAYKGEDQALKADRLRNESAQAMGLAIQATVGPSANKDSVGKVLDTALPYEKQMRDLQEQRVFLQRHLNDTGVDREQIERGLKALDQQELELRKKDNIALNGKPARVHAAPRDTTDERDAQIAQALARAKAEELQATLGITQDVHVRADLQRRILAAELAERQAGVDQQIAGILDDKGLSVAKKKELVLALSAVQAQQAVTGLIQQRAVTEQEKIAAYEQQAQESADAVKAQYELDDARAQGAEDIQRAQAELLKSSYAQAVANVAILRSEQARAETALQRQINDAAALGLSANEVEILQVQLDALKKTHAAVLAQAREATDLAHAMSDAVDAIGGFKDAWRRHDFAALLDSLEATLQTVQASFAQHGLAGGALTTAGVVSSLVGGKAGRALSTGLSYGMGASVLASGLGSIGGSMILAGGTGALGGLGMGVAGLSAMLGPLAPIIGVVAGLVVLAKAFQKPSNKGAGYDLVTGAITGKSRDEETENAVKQSGQTIVQMQAALKASGIANLDEIRGLVIGSRDESQIYTASGKTVFAAKGDPAAAAEAAFKAMLEGATYVSDTQKKLVESMVAAGKGFDDVSAALQQFAQAHALSQAIDDAIQQLTDPKGAALTQLQRAQADRAKQVAEFAAAGNYTADELAQLGAKVERLNQLELDDTLAKFANAVSDATKRLQDAQAFAGGIGDQLLQLTNPAAYQEKQIRDASAAQRTQAQDLISQGLISPDTLGQIDQLEALQLDALFQELASGVKTAAQAFDEARPRLQAWLDQLAVSPSAELSPEAARDEAVAQFRRVLAQARTGDADALSNITSYGDRALAADRSATSSAQQRLALYNEITGGVQGLVGAGGGVGATKDPVVNAITGLGPTLAAIAANTNPAAVAAAGGQPVNIINLPTLKAMYGAAMEPQTDRLVAANDRSREAIVAELVEGQKKNEAALAALGASVGAGLAGLGGAIGALAEGAAQQSDLLRQLAEETALQNTLDRQRTGT